MRIKKWIVPAVDNGRSSPACKHAIEFKIRARMFGQRQVMDGVHGDHAIEGIRFEWQVRKITNNEQARGRQAVSRASRKA